MGIRGPYSEKKIIGFQFLVNLLFRFERLLGASSFVPKLTIHMVRFTWLGFTMLILDLWGPHFLGTTDFGGQHIFETNIFIGTECMRYGWAIFIQHFYFDQNQKTGQLLWKFFPLYSYKLPYDKFYCSMLKLTKTVQDSTFQILDYNNFLIRWMDFKVPPCEVFGVFRPNLVCTVFMVLDWHFLGKNLHRRKAERFLKKNNRRKKLGF